MSAAKNKNAAPEGASSRQLRSFYEDRDKKRTTKTAIIIAAVLVVLFAAAMTINSNFIRRGTVAVSVGDVDFSPVEFNYYYNYSFETFRNMVYQNASALGDVTSLLPDTSKPFASQLYDESTGETWADFFDKMAISTMTDSAKVYSELRKVGYTLPDEDRETLDADVAELKASILAQIAATPDSSVRSFDEYLAAHYGRGMNEKIFYKVSEYAYLVDSYSEFVKNSYTYETPEINAYYDINKDKLDTFTYRYFLVSSETVTESDYDGEDAYNAAKDAALAVATAAAEDYASRVSSEEDMIAVAKEYNEVTYADESSTIRYYRGDLLGDTYGTWMRDPDRVAGDVTTIATTNGSGVYVLYYMDRDENQYPTVSMRQLLVTPATVDSTLYTVDPDDYTDEQSAEYDAAVAQADADYAAAIAQSEADAKAKADDMFQQLLTSGGNEDKLIELLEGNTSDTTEGGLYEYIYKHQMIPAVNDWLFDPARKAGDYELVQSEEYGWHLLFFKGPGESYHDNIAKTAMRDRDVAIWKDALGNPEPVYRWAFRLTK
jgi:hypothetical protein